MAKSVLDIVIRLSKTGGADKETVKGLVGMKTAIMQTAAVAGTLVAAGYTIKKVFDETVGTLVAYADQVRRVSQATGTSAEDSSKLIQVLDDMKVSYDQLEKAVAKSGKTYDYSINGLANMSDAYLKLTNTQQQAAFMQERFGKQWISFIPVMQKGGQAIRNAADEVEKGLILTQRALVETRLYEMQIDKMSDAWLAFKIQMGQGILGMLDGSTVAIQKNAQAIFEQANGFTFNVNQAGRYTQAQRDAWEAAKATAAEQYVLASGLDTSAESMDDATASAEENAAAMKLVNDQNKELLGLIGSLQNIEESFGEQYKTIAEDMSLTDDERKIKLAELSAAHDMETKKIILNLLEQKLAQDGLTTAELNYLLQKGQAWGLYSASVIAEAKKAIAEVDAIAKAIDRIPSTKNVSINVTTNGSYGAAEYVNASAGGIKKRAAGGPVSAGQMYMVGEKGPEMFVPNRNGTIVPGGGGNINIALTIASPMTIMDEQTVKKTLLPFIIDGVRQAQARGAI